MLGSVGWSLTFISLIVMYFPRWSLVLISLQHCQKTLMDTNVLLFCLYHPNTLLTHCPYNAKNIHVIRHLDLLQDSVQGNKCTRATNTSTVNIIRWDSMWCKLHLSGHVSPWVTSYVLYLYLSNKSTSGFLHSSNLFSVKCWETFIFLHSHIQHKKILIHNSSHYQQTA